MFGCVSNRFPAAIRISAVVVTERGETDALSPQSIRFAETPDVTSFHRTQTASEVTAARGFQTAPARGVEDRLIVAPALVEMISSGCCVEQRSPADATSRPGALPTPPPRHGGEKP